MFLYQFISDYGVKGSVCDVGAGCGILGLLLARDFTIELTSIEILPQMHKLCELNSTENQINSTSICGDFLQIDNTNFDYIVSNPPFYADKVLKSECEKLKSARYSESMPLDAFIKKSKKALKANGELFFCFDAKRIDEIFAAFENERGIKIIALKFVHPKSSKSAKLVLIRAKKNSKSTIEILPPSFVFDGNKYSPESEKLFAKASTQSIDICS